MIGIIGYGMVGQAVAAGFPEVEHLIVDPQHSKLTIKEMVAKKPDAIFVCVPTPSDGSEYEILTNALDELVDYTGVTIVKSTVLPKYISKYNVVYNPEFLTRDTAEDDFVHPTYLILGGSEKLCKEAHTIYCNQSIVKPGYVYFTTIETAALVKYMMNTFFATKVTFMNEMAEIAKEMGADFNSAASITARHPWMGSNHHKVPGPDGKHGFGGPCLPKDTVALYNEYKSDLLGKVLELNTKHRK